MTISLLLLVLIALLLLVLGIVSIATIYFVASRCNSSSDNKKIETTDQSIDPWVEAGRRQQ